MPQRLLRNSTVKVAEMLQRAITELAGMRKGVLTVEFILMSLIEQKDSIVLKIFDEMGLDTPNLRRRLTDRIIENTNELPEIHMGTATAAMKVSQEVQTLFDLAEKERKVLEDTYISTAAIFLACFSGDIQRCRQLLEDENLTYERTLEALRNIRGKSKITEKDGESRANILEEYTVDITAQARRGELDPVVGREDEIRRVIEILSRRKKNNPILIGEPGVGKTVIVEGLAQQIINADVPEYLLNKRVLSLEISTLIAGAKMQGEFEERLKSVKDEIIASAGEIILFIDEIHTVVGAGRTTGGLDASNMLKPALSRGLLQCIGATTLKEYKQYIETDKALERRFQQVKIGEPSVEQAIRILEGLKPNYEEHHQVEYTSPAIESAVRLSHKYIQQRFLPDKAIDLLDEAGAAKRMKLIYIPPEIRKIENEKLELEKKKIIAFNERNFEQMAKYQMQIAALQADLTVKRAEFFKNRDAEDTRVDTDDVAAIVSSLTGIPAQRMMEKEKEKLKNLEGILAARVIGQQIAVRAVSNAIRRNRSGLRRVNSPIASFLFFGPTGVGKTELAKALAEQLLDDESKIVRLDMSEFMERHSVSKIIGSPPGYVGYGEGGQLTEKIKRNPYSVILLDEFEKAHPDIYNVLLPVLDEGFLTDAEGQKISFQNCIIIGTSNIGADILTNRKKPVGIGAQIEEFGSEDERAEIMREVRKFLRPEFINRLDDIVIFNRLSRKDLSAILKIQVAELEKRLAQTNHTLQIEPDAMDFIVGSIDNLNYGARPLKRKLESLVENEIASLLVANSDHDKRIVDVKLTDEKSLVVTLKSSPK